jgi:hypothetical protein
MPSGTGYGNDWWGGLVAADRNDGFKALAIGHDHIGDDQVEGGGAKDL